VVEEKPKTAPASRPTATRPASSEPRRDKKPARKPRQRVEHDNSALMDSINETNEPEPTVMELAMKEAMEKAKDRKKKQEAHKAKSGAKEQEDILSRTLENKIQTN
jgi:hypothetical protein